MKQEDVKQIYRLYGYVKGMQLLKADPNEMKIIEELDRHISDCDMIWFLIMKYDFEEFRDDIHWQIHSYEDYINYLEDYKERHPDFINQLDQNNPVRVRKLKR